MALRAPLAILVVPLMLAALAPLPAAAKTLHAEGWEGASGWTLSSGASSDCGAAYEGSCSLLVQAPCCNVASGAVWTGTMSTRNVTEVSFAFKGSAMVGNTDASFYVRLDTGDTIVLHLTASDPANYNLYQNSRALLYVGSANTPVGTWTSTAWHKATVVIDPLGSETHARLDGVGTSQKLDMALGASAIVEVGVSAVYWHGDPMTFRFDAVTVDDHPIDETLPQGDQDQDGQGDVTETRANADPLDAGSTPWSDEDADGVTNENESSRAHALGLLTGPAVRAVAGDRFTAHFGVAGATFALVSPTGARMSVTYEPVGTPSCPGAPPRPASAVQHDCALPVVATFSLEGALLSARGAYEPGISVPASAFRVECAPTTEPEPACLVGAGVDGTWLVKPAEQAPRASTQPRLPAGFVLAVAGKTFSDVSPESGDIVDAGSGQSSRDATMAARAWNWHVQAPGSTYHACSGGLVAPCPTEGPREENVADALVFAGP